MELFQSQGCSDCPPASANVAAISDRPDVLALSFAVDYWGRLGWKGAFSKPAWTARQYAYAHAMGRDDVYTRRVVVNGRVEGDGLEPAALAGLVMRGDRGAGGPSVGFTAGAVAVSGAAPAAGGTCGSRVTIRDDRSPSQARRELRSHAAPQGCRAGDDPSRPLAGRGGDVPGARQRAELAEAAILQAANRARSLRRRSDNTNPGERNSGRERPRWGGFCCSKTLLWTAGVRTYGDFRRRHGERVKSTLSGPSRAAL